jgi:hypothetical protein
MVARRNNVVVPIPLGAPPPLPALIQSALEASNICYYPITTVKDDVHTRSEIARLPSSFTADLLAAS